MLRAKLISLENYQNWRDELTIDEILTIFEYTKKLPIVNFNVRKYCYVNEIIEYPKNNEMYLKFRNGKYGFYSNTYINAPYFPIPDFDINHIKNRINLYYKPISKFLNNTFYEELFFIIKHSIGHSISELLYNFIHDVKSNIKCLICGAPVKYRGPHKGYGDFCSDECRLSDDGIKISNLSRINTVLTKYGVPFVLQIEDVRSKGRLTSIKKYGMSNAGLYACNWKHSKWHNEICQNLKSKINDIKCLNDEQIIVLDVNEQQLLKSYCLYPDIVYKNKIIELNGDFFHANPNMYKSTDFIFKNITAQNIWDKESIRLKLFKNKGYDILIIWESEYMKDKNTIIDKCYRFLTE